MFDLFSLAVERASELWLRTGQHLILTGISTGGAIALGIPLGILAARVAALRGAVLGVAGILQTIPSLAMLVILLVLFGQIGTLPAIVALTLYALLPIVRNTLAGLEGVAPEVKEAAQGIGMTRGQQLRAVDLPLAAPVILAGIRTAAVVGVGIATLSAFIGAGGLGQFINRGLSLQNNNLILLGAIPAAILALIVDSTLGAAQWGMQPTRQSERGTLRAKLKPIGLLSPAILVIFGFVTVLTAPGRGYGSGNTGKVVHVGSKNFGEQFVLAELMAQIIAARTDLNVERHLNMAGTMMCHESLVRGALDTYPEYTGTALTSILDRDPAELEQDPFKAVRNAYRERFDLVWLEPFGFDNTYTLTVRREDAEQNGWETISDLAKDASDLTAGFTSEFSERPDGYPGLAEKYDMQFTKVRDLYPSIMYEAVDRGEVDVICAFATDARIVEFDLKTLEDDKNFFPPYEAAPVVRRQTLEDHPELGRALRRLAGRLDDKTMRRLNRKVDIEQIDAAKVARSFLEEQGLLGPPATQPAATPQSASATQPSSRLDG